MARFYTTTDNSRGNVVSAMGNKSGQGAHIRGWNSGIRVHAHPGSLTGDEDYDVFDVYATSGSRGAGRDMFLGSLVNGEFISAEQQKENEREHREEATT